MQKERGEKRIYGTHRHVACLLFFYFVLEKKKHRTALSVEYIKNQDSGVSCISPCTYTQLRARTVAESSRKVLSIIHIDTYTRLLKVKIWLV
jgi:hypothetical protein